MHGGLKLVLVGLKGDEGNCENIDVLIMIGLVSPGVGKGGGGKKAVVRSSPFESDKN